MVVVIMHACYFGDSTVANFNTVFIKIFLQKKGGGGSMKIIYVKIRCLVLRI